MTLPELLAHPWLVLALILTALVVITVMRAASFVLLLIGIAFIAVVWGSAAVGALVTGVPF